MHSNLARRQTLHMLPSPMTGLSETKIEIDSQELYRARCPASSNVLVCVLACLYSYLPSTAGPGQQGPLVWVAQAIDCGSVNQIERNYCCFILNQLQRRCFRKT